MKEKRSATMLDLNNLFEIEENNSYTILQLKNPKNKITIYDPGLYHTAICKSDLSKIDKQNGKLYYRGLNVIDLLDEDFLKVAYMIIFGEGPNNMIFQKAVLDHFQLYPEQKTLLDAISFSCHPMHVLSMAVTGLSAFEGRVLNDPTDLIEKAAFITAQVAITVAYRYTKMFGLPWIEENKGQTYSEKILFQMHSGMEKQRLKTLGKILNTIMILHAEHGQNCSSATVRNIASAKGSVYSGIASGMAAFNGAIHGGASEQVSAMYESFLGSNRDLKTYIEEKCRKKELIMGFGQRTYNRIENCWDPRVETMFQILNDDAFDFPEVEEYKRIALQLIKLAIDHPYLKEKNLTPNPDLFNCIFFKLFGARKEMNTTMLALGRIAGWIANYYEHVKHQYPLTRPCDLT